MYQERFYRQWMEAQGLESFQVVIKESDLFILSDRAGRSAVAYKALKEVRSEIESYISTFELFKHSLSPISVDREAPATIKAMARAGRAWNVGPMAAVAGAVAEFVGRRMVEDGQTVIVENGGDVFAVADRRLTFALWAGQDSPFKDRIAFEVDAIKGVGVCTSSGKVGPSKSFGNADAVVAIAGDTAFADAAATSIANRIQTPEDVAAAVEEQKTKGDLIGVIACAGDRLGVWGDVEITRR